MQQGSTRFQDRRRRDLFRDAGTAGAGQCRHAHQRRRRPSGHHPRRHTQGGRRLADGRQSAAPFPVLQHEGPLFGGDGQRPVRRFRYLGRPRQCPGQGDGQRFQRAPLPPPDHHRGTGGVRQRHHPRPPRNCRALWQGASGPGAGQRLVCGNGTLAAQSSGRHPGQQRAGHGHLAHRQCELAHGRPGLPYGTFPVPQGSL